MKTKKAIVFTILSIISLIGFIVFLSLVISKYNFKLDLLNLKIINVRSNFLTIILKAITAFGSAVVLITISLILLIFVKNKKVGCGLLCGVASATILNLIIKNIIKRPRPNNALMLIEETGYSFPSAHAMLSLVFFALIIYFILKNINKKWLKITLSILFGVIAILVGISRIYLGVHYVSDVLAGYLLSLPIVFVTILIVENK